MHCTLLKPDVVATLEREHAAARAMHAELNAQSDDQETVPRHARDFRTSEVHRTQYLSIGPRTGRFLYNSARSINAQNIMEFGTSFGISTMYLAAAAADTGGKVTGSEYHVNKAEKARANLTDAGLATHAEVLLGDARETLSTVQDPIDLLFLDGAKELYIEILTMLEDRLRPGALVIADNAEKFPQDGVFMQHLFDGTRYLTTLLGSRHALVSQSFVLP